MTVDTYIDSDTVSSKLELRLSVNLIIEKYDLVNAVENIYFNLHMMILQFEEQTGPFKNGDLRNRKFNQNHEVSIGPP